MKPFVFAALIALTGAGCGKQLACKSGTLLLHVTLQGAALAADALDFTVTVAGAPRHGPTPLAAGV
jgi:hypothetical protein